LTKQLLGYARKGKYEIKRLDLNLLVREISEIFGMTKKQIRIHLELAEDLFVVNADQGQIEQLLLNIFINAADAMPTGGDLYITAMNTNAKNIKHKSFKVKDSGNFIQIVIRDTGIGMDQKIVDRIFEPFFTTKGLASGTGLGMASVYGIIKGHGGYINVKSKVGRGTTFDIYLPAAGESILKNKESNIEAVKGQGTLLLVDDEDVILEVAQEYLNLLGYNVLLAKGGKAAIDIYQQKKDEIDMVLLDMVMPDLSGGDTYDRVKEINPHVKVLLSSGYSIDGQARDIINRGCNGFIQKPFTLKDLSYKLKEVLGPA
jgi:two-component system cell cycle sensor histidine kinase/response regulator CckA